MTAPNPGSAVLIVSPDGMRAAEVDEDGNLCIKLNVSGVTLNVDDIDGVALTDGEAHVGSVGGGLKRVPVQLTVAAALHAVGAVIGGIVTVPSLARAAGKTGYVVAASLFSKIAFTGQIDIFIFNASPAASTTADNSAFSLHANDVNKLLGVIHVTDWSALGAAYSLGFVDNCRVPVDGLAGSDLYLVLVARTAITFTGTADMSVMISEDHN